jgi:hypothetical protein
VFPFLAFFVCDCFTSSFFLLFLPSAQCCIDSKYFGAVMTELLGLASLSLLLVTFAAVWS